MGIVMELRHLRYFMAVAAARNFTRAANQLGMAQPPLSRQILELEQELGANLFERKSRPIALTDAGRLLLDLAHDTLNSVDRLKHAMRRYKENGRQRFVIGFVGSTIYGPVPTMLRSFRALAPELDIDLVEMNTLAQMKALKDGSVDAGIGRLIFEDSAIERQVLELEPLVVALPTDHPLAPDRSSVSILELLEDTLIVYPSEPRPSYADQILGLFRQYAATPQHIREVRELQTALGLVVARAGISIVPNAVRRLRRDDIAYRPISEPDAVSPIILSWRASDASPALNLLRSVWRDIDVSA
ncbi:LysR family transcriptional regulator [Sphingobium boeckii]|uniref:DNA-binding transcriptional LysR family regulator n=1 Tax=Sphingobium boeckii TaxID=1082345 RepID=A0A7W9AIJ6_9SPHN|nr:LysR family transcriptional regulator [Sphingobium boeckii]MBB5686332.1 DNA-binding transcriptional LysR family regulator [Sphingobium boeckii]